MSKEGSRKSIAGGEVGRDTYTGEATVSGRTPGYKRPFDLTLLIGVLVLLLPLWLALWITIPILIWLEDKGPIFYSQDRVGKNGRIFRLLKFRSMRDHLEGDHWPEDTLIGDPRITKVGKFIRRTALDEIPQMVNLWRGDISLVGSRALPIQMHQVYLREEPRFDERQEATPGLTGLAQLYLPRHCSATKRLRYDLIYIRRASIWLDIKLIISSVRITISGKWGSGVRERD